MSSLIDLEYLVVHHSASPNTWSFARIDRMHRDRGWDGAGYQWGIERSGALKHGRPLWKTGAHCPPYNQKSWGVCVIGDNTTPDEAATSRWRRNDHSWTNEQWDTLQLLVDRVVWLVPTIKVVGHYEIGRTPTLCPAVDGASLRATLGL